MAHSYSPTDDGVRMVDALTLRFGILRGLIRDETKSFVVRLFFGGRYVVTSVDRHVTPADWRRHAFTPRQWDALFPRPLDEADEA